VDDVVYIGTVILYFAAAWAIIEGCEALRRRRNV
jgi:hypothetical protein